jgi:hypothetical protein
MSENNDNKNNKMKSIGRLYEKRDKNGELFLSGDIDAIKILVFANDKDDGTDYDWNIFELEVGIDWRELKPAVGFLYEKRDKNEETYYNGSYYNRPIMIFKNRFKKEDKHPDWTIFPSGWFLKRKGDHKEKDEKGELDE